MSYLSSRRSNSSKLDYLLIAALFAEACSAVVQSLDTHARAQGVAEGRSPPTAEVSIKT